MTSAWGSSWESPQGSLLSIGPAINGEYLFHSLNAYTLDEIPFNLYYGIGARVKFTSETQFGIRFPLGTTYTPTSTPLEVFCEIVPLMDLAPDTAFRFNTGLGIRYYF
jgi:hypothetical protein